ncbi:Calcium-dependent protein kinase 2 (PfCDPK2) [Durusdinium trenchii]|uniref:Calcium-dependent protein kinase 2 (PfCDPK2) n=1 Tax=Durusdinium trenchii TaxID=1381693 RepID=A0ABP0KGK1_9DINO
MQPMQPYFSQSGVNVTTGYALGSQPAAPPPVYVYQGQQYSDFRQLQAAMQQAPAPRTTSWEEVLKDPSALERKVKELFARYAGADRKLDPQELHGLAMSVGADLGVDPTAFGDIRTLFHRFDFSGDGHLDEQETFELIQYMLRVFRDLQQKRAAHLSQRPVVQDFGASIKFKGLEEFFDLQKKLGQGGQGAVYLAAERSTNVKRVVKCYDKNCANAPVEDIVAEFKLLTKLDHPKIARVYEVFQDHAYIYVVSEPYYGGDLTTCAQRASQNGVTLNQEWLAGILKQICAGILYLHNNRCMHCDIKEPNVMISRDADWNEPNVVVIDFGLARDFKKGSTGVMGTPGYMPPEVWTHGVWTIFGDVFSLGVLFYNMYCLHQRKAFEGTTIPQLKAQACQCAVDWQPLSNCISFQQMVQQMMQPSFKVRPKIEQVMMHEWWRSAGKEVTSPKGMSELSKIKPTSDLHRALMMDMVNRENLTHLKELNDLFTSMDADHSGVVTEAEARQALKTKMPPAELDEFVNTLMGSNRQVTYSQFMAEMIAAKKADNDEVLWRMFKELDSDNNNSLDANEIRAMLQKPKVREIMADRTLSEVMDRMNLKSTGHVSFQDFKRALETAEPVKEKTAQLREGDKVQYFSTSYAQWMDTTITAMDATGAMQLQCKPGYWLPPEELHKVRRPL